MDLRAFQTLAHELVRTDSPAHLRSAISRAYYASHLLARRFLESLDSDFPVTGVSKQGPEACCAPDLRAP